MIRSLALAAALLSSLALAEAPKRIELKVGEQVSVGYVTSPICDAPSVAVLSAEGNGTMKGVGPGRTLCSGETPVGLRQVFEVVVTEPAESETRSDSGAEDVTE